VFEVDGPSGSLSANELTIARGSADIGGGIASFGGTLWLDEVHVSGNSAALAGGESPASASRRPSSRRAPWRRSR
jgi:hypothetical protein